MATLHISALGPALLCAGSAGKLLQSILVNSVMRYHLANKTAQKLKSTNAYLIDAMRVLQSAETNWSQEMFLHSQNEYKRDSLGLFLPCTYKERAALSAGWLIVCMLFSSLFSVNIFLQGVSNLSKKYCHFWWEFPKIWQRKEAVWKVCKNGMK